jgi:hypothetical protein
VLVFCGLLLHADALRLAVRRIAAAPLFPVADQEITLEIEQPLKLPDLVQEGQAWATLDDLHRRPSVVFGGAEMYRLAGAVDVEVDRSVNCVSSRHAD